MDQPQRSIRTRQTSESLQRKIAYALVNRTNTCKGYQKSEEEHKELKRTQSEHKKLLKEVYKGNYTSRILNLPQYRYEIS